MNLEARIKALELAAPVKTVKSDPAKFWEWLAEAQTQAEQKRAAFDAMPRDAQLAHLKERLADLRAEQKASPDPGSFTNYIRDDLIRTTGKQIAELEAENG